MCSLFKISKLIKLFWIITIFEKWRWIWKVCEHVCVRRRGHHKVIAGLESVGLGQTNGLVFIEHRSFNRSGLRVVKTDPQSFFDAKISAIERELNSIWKSLGFEPFVFWRPERLVCVGPVEGTRKAVFRSQRQLGFSEECLWAGRVDLLRRSWGWEYVW
jgi:hypothetical protein